MPEYLDPSHELLQRTRRIETRLMKLCSHLGFDPSRDRDRLVVKNLDPLVLDVAGLDVSLGDLLDTCRKNDINGSITLQHKGVLLATIVLGEQGAVQN